MKFNYIVARLYARNGKPREASVFSVSFTDLPSDSIMARVIEKTERDNPEWKVDKVDISVFEERPGSRLIDDEPC